MDLQLPLYFYHHEINATPDVIFEVINDDKEILTSEEPKQIKNEGLTMMLETEVGSGEYVVSNDTTWPQDGYIFNYDLSGCENGGTLSWNSETNRVVMQTTSSDK